MPQYSSMDDELLGSPEVALHLKDVHKSYGRRSKKLHVLCGMTMLVPKGNIYGLLGPSGCGKTTALRCAVGRLPVDKGSVLTLGKKPNTMGHGVPGCRVGYMPQELALYKDLTMGETLTYFGRLHKMSRRRIKERIGFLLKFLHLPEESRLISKLSGGQQRRTSFAIALLQEPEILILDEPTVGVDPLLRQGIWDHLLELARDSGITIVITTHYIEEARQAHVVGLMRNGRLLAEAHPNALMQTHQKQQLEDVFFLLCQQDQRDDWTADESRSAQGQGLKQEDSATAEEGDRSYPRGGNTVQADLVSDLLQSQDDDPLLPDVVAQSSNKVSCGVRVSSWIPSGWNILALLIKQLTLMRRNIGALLFEFILPSFQIVLFCLCVGRTPFDLTMSVVNAESSGYCPAPCDFSRSLGGCCFLSFIDTHTISQVNYSHHLENALSSVEEGKSWGVIEIRQNFTAALFQRLMSNKTIDNVTISNSDVHLYLDMTNQQIAYTIQSEILKAMEKFINYLLVHLGQDPEKAQIPVAYEEPIYGSEDPSFTNFMAPGIIISITFFMATGLTALVFVQERKQGLMDRSFVAGATSVEIMIGHILTQCIVMGGQVALLLVFALAVFSVPYKGPVVLVIVLTLMQGLVGMALGLLISAVCDEEVSAIQAALGSVYPNLLLSGIIWPLEGMPYWLRTFSSCLPMTYASQAMRSVLARGWTISHIQVWRGFLVSLAWGWALMAISAIILTLKKN